MYSQRIPYSKNPVMQKILTGSQVKDLDANHVKITGESSLKLMESAAESFVTWFLGQGFRKDKKILIAVGAGNNGGDGLAVARMLVERQFQVAILDCYGLVEKFSPDALLNFNLLPKSVQVLKLDVDVFEQASILIDAYLGLKLQKAPPLAPSLKYDVDLTLELLQWMQLVLT